MNQQREIGACDASATTGSVSSVLRKSCTWLDGVESLNPAKSASSLPYAEAWRRTQANMFGFLAGIGAHRQDLAWTGSNLFRLLRHADVQSEDGWNSWQRIAEV